MIDYKMNTFMVVCKTLNFTQASKELKYNTTCCFKSYKVASKKNTRNWLFKFQGKKWLTKKEDYY